MTLSEKYFSYDTEQVPIVTRKRRGAKNIVLRYQPVKRCLTLTVPYGVSEKQALAFVEKKRAWVEDQLLRKNAKVAFAPDAELSVLGEPLRIAHAGGRGVVHVQNGSLCVPGAPEFLVRRVREWLIKTAREAITQSAHEKARGLGATVKKISLRDTHSMWGSCNSAGNLTFSWRLVLAPPEVLDYIVSHEVAHLKELNHSAAFWRIVESLCPHFQESRRWLKKHGHTLYRFH